MALLKDRSIHLDIAGTGGLEADLRRQVERLGLDSRVRFLGHVEDMPMHYRSADMFVLP
jgi:glycosyltransferase involved in cell wall biosynthesis